MLNTEIWNALKTPPETALKEIKGGRLKGMHDINPQWRYHALTKKFGPCGVGWKYDIKKLWLEMGSAGQTAAFAEVWLYYKYDGEWSEPIPGIGGSMFIAEERSGSYTSDEAFKMAVTDGLGTAAKMIGLAADVYLGNYDGSKYRESAPQQAADNVPDCPKCKKPGRKDKNGTGYYCWKKKGGCGHTWDETAQEIYGDSGELPGDESREQPESTGPVACKNLKANVTLAYCEDSKCKDIDGCKPYQREKVKSYQGSTGDDVPL